jgi:predicted MFS family arabinose efflux permease
MRSVSRSVSLKACVTSANIAAKSAAYAESTPLTPALRFLLVLAAGFVGAASLGKLVPHLDWIAGTYGVALGLAGFALSCVMLPGALAGWKFGGLSDRFGAKRIAITGLVIAAAASLAGGYPGSFVMLVALRIVEGAGYSMIVIAGTVLAAEAIPGRGVLALSVWSAFAPIGFALGQWAGAFAPRAAPLPAIGAVHAAILIATALALWVAVRPSAMRASRGSAWQVIGHLSARRSAIAFGTSCGVIIAAVALAPVVLANRSGLPLAQVASYTALASLAGLAGRIAPGWLLERGITPFAIFASAGAVAVVSLVACFTAPLWPALACFVVFQTAAGAMPGLLSAMMQQVAPPEELGAFSGICNQVINIGNLLGPPLGLAAYAAGGTGGALALLVGVTAAGAWAIGGLGVYRRRLGEAAR